MRFAVEQTKGGEEEYKKGEKKEDGAKTGNDGAQGMQ